LARKRGTLLAHRLGRKAGIRQAIGGKTGDQPSVGKAGNTHQKRSRVQFHWKD